MGGCGEVTETAVAQKDAENPLVLAIDIGTSSTRCFVYDALGRQVDGLEDRRLYRIEKGSPGAVTIDPNLLLTLTAECIDGVLDRAEKRAPDIAAVAFDTFWHSVLGVDEQNAPTTPIFTWADTRSARAAQELRNRLDAVEVHAVTGAFLHPSYLPAKLLWIHQAMKVAARKTAYWMSPGEYFYLRLFGERRVSISMASGTGLFDQRTCMWDMQVIGALPIDAAQLTPVSEFSNTFSGLCEPFHTRWPQLASIPWYLALGDGACSNVGSGGFREDRLVVMVGTSGALRVVREAADFEIPPGVWSYRVDRKRIVQGGALSSGGNVFSWFAGVLRFDDLAALERDLTPMAPDSSGLTVLPFLAGERSPSWDPDAESAVVGLTLDTSGIELMRAVMEAIAIRFGLVLTLLEHKLPPFAEIIASGAGLVDSPVWMQIMSDVFGRPIRASALKEATSRGAALLVLEAMGVLTALDTVPAPLGATFSPHHDRTAMYRKAARRQEELYGRLSS
jgi:gluconokinase